MSVQDSDDWKPFDVYYEVSAAGVVRNRNTKRILQVEGPKAEDPHKYVRLILKGSPIKFGSNNQRRMAVRNLVAHVWLPESAGFRLTPEGLPASSNRVYYIDKDPHNCSVSNLQVLSEQDALQQGLAITSRFGNKEEKRQQRHERQQQPKYNSTPPELLQNAVRQGGGSDLSWPSDFDNDGRRL